MALDVDLDVMRNAVGIYQRVKRRRLDLLAAGKLHRASESPVVTSQCLDPFAAKRVEAGAGRVDPHRRDRAGIAHRLCDYGHATRTDPMIFRGEDPLIGCIRLHRDHARVQSQKDIGPLPSMCSDIKDQQLAGIRAQQGSVEEKLIVPPPDRPAVP